VRHGVSEDNNDKETLRQTLKNTNKKLSDVMAASQRRQQTLEKRAEDWQEFKVKKIFG
jgi:plasmid stability protein